MRKRKSVSLTLGRGEKSRKGGLTAKGRAKYNRATGSNLKAPVTKKSGLTESEKKRRKSFCALVLVKGLSIPLRELEV